MGNWSENRGLTLPVFRLRQTANQDLPALPGAELGYALRVARYVPHIMVMEERVVKLGRNEDLSGKVDRW